MKKVLLSAVAALGLAASAQAADLPMKARPVVAPPPPSLWEIAVGGAAMSDYNFRGISQSDRGPSATAYFEPRWNVLPNLQLYSGIQGWAVKLPTDPTGEFDLYGGIRPTFGPVTFDFGAMYYWYPREQQVFFDPATGGRVFAGFPGAAPWTKTQTDFLEFYAKANWTVNEQFTLGGYVYYADDWLNTGADATYFGGSAKYTLPSSMFPKDWGMYVSGEVAHYLLGTADAFFAFLNFPDYTYWNVGFGVTWQALTLDFRYHGTDLNNTECFLITGDLRGLTGGGGPAGQSKWCGDAFILKAAFDTTIK